MSAVLASPVLLVVALVALQRLGELAYARRNTRRLLQEGGVEIAARHYPLFVLLHAGWLAAIVLLVPLDRPVIWPLLVLFLMLQLARLWVMASLGRYWTTRIITLPDAPLVRRGPFRWVRHPNYLVVFAEVIVLPLAFGAWAIAIPFGIANAALLCWRIWQEESALVVRRPLEAASDRP